MAGLEMQPWQWELLRYMLAWPNPFTPPQPQFPRTDGSLDPAVVCTNQLVAEWMAANPHPGVELPARRRSTEQWLAWLRAEGFIDDAENPYGYTDIFSTPE
jgi:hypothetical protein